MKRLETRLSKVKTTFAQEKDRLQDLKQVLSRERADVDIIEGLSLTGMFHQILGSREKKLDKERQEFLSAKLKHDECQRSLAAQNQKDPGRRRKDEKSYRKIGRGFAAATRRQAKKRAAAEKEKKILIERA